MVLDEGVILELGAPGTGEPVRAGRGRRGRRDDADPGIPADPLCHRRSLGAAAGPSPCGRTNHRISGWLGRADQTAKVRGMFVHPEQVAEIVRRHKSIIRARLVVERPASADEMTLLVEIGEPAEDAARIAETCRR